MTCYDYSIIIEEVAEIRTNIHTSPLDTTGYVPLLRTERVHTILLFVRCLTHFSRIFVRRYNVDRQQSKPYRKTMSGPSGGLSREQARGVCLRSHPCLEEACVLDSLAVTSHSFARMTMCSTTLRALDRTRAPTPLSFKGILNIHGFVLEHDVCKCELIHRRFCQSHARSLSLL